MSNSITIPLSKTGKHAGKHEAIVSPEDKDLLDLNWSVTIRKNNIYATYSKRMGKGKQITFLMHRVILERMIGRPLEKGEIPDHRDNNGLNNTRENLRLATYSQNLMNQRSRNGASGLKGVHIEKRTGKFVAHIGINGKMKHLGTFSTKEEAKKAYDNAALELFKTFARL